MIKFKKKIIELFKPFILLISREYRHQYLYTLLIRVLKIKTGSIMYIPNEAIDNTILHNVYKSLEFEESIDKHVWVIDKRSVLKFEKDLLQNKKNKFVKNNSISYYLYLIKSNVIINHYNLPEIFQRNNNQVIITCYENEEKINNLTNTCLNTDYFFGKAVDIISSSVLEVLPELKVLSSVKEIKKYLKSNSDNKMRAISKKKNILIWAGGFSTNGITNAFLNLSNCLDYDKCNLILVIEKKDFETNRENIRKINPNVKTIIKNVSGYLIYEYYLQRLIYLIGLDFRFIKRLLPYKFYKNEYNRIVGNCKIDTVIDFCGYTNFWTLLFSFNPISNKIIYLHSDMLADSKRSKAHKRGSKITFNLYENFDSLICVSKDATKVNKENLRRYNVDHKIINIDNLIDYKKVLSKSKDEQCLNNFIEDQSVKFITIGRLSREKDHAKLINAFHKVKHKHKNIKLYIVGDGEQKKRLIEQVISLKLEQHVIFLGEMDNPFAVLKFSDCFVLSSNYEGQSLVVLEALILNKPVISTDVTGVRSIINENYGMLVPNSVQGLAQGMTDFIENNPVFEEFDYEKYNEIAITKFYKCVLQ